jgi:2-polyprenyl-3-methyl-5-hydroxy-6-metoxy-1,4-benzoquinol methylase
MSIANSQETNGLEACRLCGGRDCRTRYLVRGERIVRCQSCGLVQLARHPSQEDLTRLYASDYFKMIKYDLDPAARKELERRLGFMQAAGLRPGARVLDVGCATGDFILGGQERYEMWGYDFSAYAAQTARERVPRAAARIFSGAWEAVPVAPGFFDAVTFWDVVEHLDEPGPAIGRAVRLVRPGGLVFFSSPNVGTVMASLMGGRWAFMTPPEHISFYSRRTLELLLRKCGLEVTRWMTRGKWINLAFLVYKAGRVFPEAVPGGLIRWLNRSRLGRLNLYLPTGDIQYAAVTLPEKV